MLALRKISLDYLQLKYFFLVNKSIKDRGSLLKKEFEKNKHACVLGL
jgi:hypothetical protein